MQIHLFGEITSRIVYYVDIVIITIVISGLCNSALLTNTTSELTENLEISLYLLNHPCYKKMALLVVVGYRGVKKG